MAQEQGDINCFKLMLKLLKVHREERYFCIDDMINKWIAIKLHKTRLPRVKTSEVPDASPSNETIMYDWNIIGSSMQLELLVFTSFTSKRHIFGAQAVPHQNPQPNTILAIECNWHIRLLWLHSATFLTGEAFCRPHVGLILKRKPVIASGV